MADCREIYDAGLRQTMRLRTSAKPLLLLSWLLWALLAKPVQAGRLEAGIFTAHDTFGNDFNPERVNFQQPFDTVPIVVALSDSTGGNSASIRITNVTTTGFDELILEPDNFDGGHLAQIVHYIAVEPGRHVLPGGHTIEAGRLNTAATQFGNGFTGVATFTTVGFSAPLPAAPTLISQIQTANSETRNVADQSSRPHITAISQNAGTNNFQIALDRSQSNTGVGPVTETLGWIAFPNATVDSLPDVSGNNVQWSALNTATNIRGWLDGCFTNTTGLNSTTAVVIAKKRTRNSFDGGWLRSCGVGTATIGLRVDEDTDQDDERNIAVGDAESAAIISFSQPFHANLVADLALRKSVVGFVDQFGSDHALPGAEVEYRIEVTNDGNAPPDIASVIITDVLQAEIALRVDDFAQPGSGPVEFIDGTPPSGLTCLFISLASPNDCIDFSTDGVNFNYVPVAGGDGTDSAVTHIRFTPAGFMASDQGNGAPGFSIGLRALLR